MGCPTCSQSQDRDSDGLVYRVYLRDSHTGELRTVGTFVRFEPDCWSTANEYRPLTAEPSSH